MDKSVKIDRLINIIERSGLKTQKNFSEKVEISKTYLSEIINGKKLPPKHLGLLLKEKLNVSLDYWENGVGPIFNILPDNKLKYSIRDIDFDTDYSFLLSVSKSKLKELGVLNEYIDHRGGDKFDEYGYDHITILQAKRIGLIK